MSTHFYLINLVFFSFLLCFTLYSDFIQNHQMIFFLLFLRYPKTKIRNHLNFTKKNKIAKTLKAPSRGVSSIVLPQLNDDSSSAISLLPAENALSLLLGELSLDDFCGSSHVAIAQGSLVGSLLLKFSAMICQPV